MQSCPARAQAHATTRGGDMFSKWHALHTCAGTLAGLYCGERPRSELHTHVPAHDATRTLPVVRGRARPCDAKDSAATAHHRRRECSTCLCAVAVPPAPRYAGGGERGRQHRRVIANAAPSGGMAGCSGSSSPRRQTVVVRLVTRRSPMRRHTPLARAPRSAPRPYIPSRAHATWREEAAPPRPAVGRARLARAHAWSS